MVFFTLVFSVINLALGYALALCLQSRRIAPAWPRELLARLGMLGPEGSADDDGNRSADPIDLHSATKGVPADAEQSAPVPAQLNTTTGAVETEDPQSAAPLSSVDNIVRLDFSETPATPAGSVN